MEHTKMVMTLVAVIVAVHWAGAAAQSDCTNVLISLSPCLNYITGNSSTPSQACCTQLATVVRSQPQCLCQVLNGGGSSFGININQTQALALPRVCNVQTPSISSCNVATPTGSPAGAPESSNNIPSGTGSKTVPSTDNDSSDGTSNTLSKPLLFSILLASAYASAFKLY
ncbi:non-specific lipid-transfer protein-like protein At2g13820 [Cucurbita pepo subsp. pepo]|uniref:non-specific lipid-transfer protein-like protein At2g13820 n=1 Tax=Cucurbita pepo subsp. pepo TaxID=3664 RepID=UPI000C9D5A1A|nr:non-specific lipid-transfer protein-like protein At2g13820 [Cucurbita pepo subsp. pepo]